MAQFAQKSARPEESPAPRIQHPRTSNEPSWNETGAVPGPAFRDQDSRCTPRTFATTTDSGSTVVGWASFGFLWLGGKKGDGGEGAMETTRRFDELALGSLSGRRFTRGVWMAAWGGCGIMSDTVEAAEFERERSTGRWFHSSFALLMISNAFRLSWLSMEGLANMVVVIWEDDMCGSSLRAAIISDSCWISVSSGDNSFSRSITTRLNDFALGTILFFKVSFLKTRLGEGTPARSSWSSGCILGL
ncbi:hypothetical protein OGATHE_005701 [Ogataea polymorpha]|uniref:Uncharacterized protein n=1 Tax=Ogataea polymorpha TaxID=460523 RepID=A0A9P8SYS8_9ASCO|nr:hypothetical protein OGATHE_005701 [Ogataea polymorpha]